MVLVEVRCSVEGWLKGSRKGFLETGRAGGSSKGECGRGGEKLLGDAARLRNGLFEERLRANPGPDDDGRW